jgi:hypothetical protein
MVATGSDDEFAYSDVEMMPTPDSQTENKAPPKRRAAAKSKAVVTGSRVAKAKAPGRRTSGASVLATTTTTAPKGRKGGARKALKELESVNDNGNETEEVEDFEQEEPMKPAKKGRATKPKAAPKTTKTTARGGPAKPGKRAACVEPTVKYIPDTQPEPMQIEPTILQEEEEDEPTLRPVASSRPIVPPMRQARSTSRQPESLIAPRRRAGSASSTERGGDPALRRKLGDMTRKFESLDLKYKQLKEVGSTDAVTNFEKLRRSTEQRAQGKS